ncbi:transketolase C-terminal domain-containing protein, partial [Devosia sp.]
WQLAIEAEKPSILALSRQNLPALRTEIVEGNPSSKGAYVIAGGKDADAVIFATGSEVAIAVSSLDLLSQQGISGKVVSVPSMELFFAQSQEYRDSVIGKPKAKVAIEAGIEMSWLKLLGDRGRFVGMHSFGASAPAEKLYEHFGITANAIVEAVMAQL